MKNEVLRFLREQEEYLSGEEISRRLGISRTAVWKQINTLKKEGYEIASQTRIGYRLISVPDRLYPEEIQKQLRTNLVGRNMIYRERVDSTNILARQTGETGFVDGTVILAEEQTAGKGRLGRVWHSPMGTGINMSLLLRPAIPVSDAAKITLLTGAAVARGLEEITGLKIGIKWPNDLQIQGKKVSGILTEIKADMDQIHYLIVGIGINVNEQDFPEELRETATSLHMEVGRQVSRIETAAVVLNHWEEIYQRFLTQGFTVVREEWKQYAVTLGKEVHVRTINETIHGQALDIDEDGLLLVQDEDHQIHRIMAGDVTLRT
ncbi:biotin--[acetyl-CoA-carboxylase] ligase [Dehalobacterium formicoaceticum]|uniref:Bifunctional ligase/repressor BirA n=1 Tax=Dehalobacterium formicoaceticum TaxID=51515 RepID=A0ABT1Y346_9FIRM|nr:biotin--[acetyl-CoA-carboxylase] ligase [Dehalobacterium formicoaceticum]MCR6545293.1 biotin--[acetyl-CoA-carboxylase] ligase [Dehalobacterium formicoaceticum]